MFQHQETVRMKLLAFHSLLIQLQVLVFDTMVDINIPSHRLLHAAEQTRMMFDSHPLVVLPDLETIASYICQESLIGKLCMLSSNRWD